MALDLSSARHPIARQVTLTVSNQATEIQLGHDAIGVSLRFQANAGQVAFTGTDGAAISSDKITLDSGTWYENVWTRPRPPGQGLIESIFIAATTVPTTVDLQVVGQE